MSLVIRSSFDALKHAAKQVDKDLLGRHHNQSAQGCAANSEKLGRVDEREELAAGHHEAAQHRAQNHDESRNNEHLANLSVDKQVMPQIHQILPLQSLKIYSMQRSHCADK